MAALRRLLRTCPALAALIVAAALAVRVLVPAGYMPTLDNGRIVIGICNGYGPMTMAIAVSGLDHHGDADGHPAPRPGAFPALPPPLVGGGGPRPPPPGGPPGPGAARCGTASPRPPRAAAGLRPPLRGPPLVA